MATMQPQASPVQAKTAALRTMHALAVTNGWAASAKAIALVINEIKQSTF